MIRIAIHIVAAALCCLSWIAETHADDKQSLGKFLLRVQRYEDALVVYNELIGKRSSDSQLYHNRGVAYLHTGQLDKALADFNESITLDPKNAEAYNSRGVCWFYKGDYEKAVQDYTRAIECNPQLTRAYNQLAWILSVCPNPRIRNGSRAVELAKKAVELEPSAYHYDTLAAAYAEAGQFKDAVKIQKRALLMQLTEGRTQALERYTERLRSYEAKKPWRERNAAGMYQAEPTPGKTGSSPITITAMASIDMPAENPSAPSKIPPQASDAEKKAMSEKSPSPLPAEPIKQYQSSTDTVPKAIEKAEQSVPAAMSSPPKGIGITPFSVIIGSSQYRQKAYRIAMKLRSKGDAPFIVRETDPVTGEWYKIYLGNFSSAMEAWHYIDTRLKNRFRDPQVTYLPYAVMLGKPPTPAESRNQEAVFMSKGYWVYSAEDPRRPGQNRLLVGAFEKDVQAMELAGMLQQAGQNVQVVMR
ncbi:MAG: tetratricopeptide repeat protein [Thermodesulfobacteriota bacterium]